MRPEPNRVQSVPSDERTVRRANQGTPAGKARGRRSPSRATGAVRDRYLDRDRWNTTPRAVARTLLRERAHLILAVDIDPADKPEEQHPTAYGLDEETGLWDTSTKPWTRLCFGLAATLRKDLRASGLEGAAYVAADASIRKIERPSAVKELRRAIWAAADELGDEGDDPDLRGLTRCKPEQLDAQQCFIGAENGIIDLHRGELLDPSEGRKALVTLCTPVVYDPDARHPDVDRLFGHLVPEEQDWWWAVLGYHLRGNPSGRVYLVKGPPDGGKSTVAQALRITLGPYASTPAFGAIEERRQHHETELSPGVHAFTRPRRLALMDEVKTKNINNRLVKDLSGGGSVTYRLLKRNLQTQEVTATILMFCNDGSEPRLNLEDRGMQKRYRELPYPAIPKAQIDPTFITERIRTDEFKRALLTRLVAEAAAAANPPPNVPAVDSATAERVREDIGELGEFARRIRRGGNSVLIGNVVWQAWCEYVGSDTNGEVAGGINKRGMAKALGGRVNGLPAPRLYSVNNKKVRGWRGWRLLLKEPLDVTEAAEKAINEMVEAFPKLTDDQREQLLRQFRERVMSPEILLAIDEVHGADLEQAIEDSHPPAYGPDGKQLPGWLKLWKRRGMTDHQATAMMRVHGIETLAMTAEMIVDAKRPKSPAYQQVLHRYHALPVVTVSQESRALNYLRLAERELGVDATASALAAAAIELVNEDAAKVVSGQDGRMVRNAEIETVDGKRVLVTKRLSPDQAERFIAETKAVIQKLCGLATCTP